MEPHAVTFRYNHQDGYLVGHRSVATNMSGSEECRLEHEELDLSESVDEVAPMFPVSQPV